MSHVVAVSLTQQRVHFEVDVRLLVTANEAETCSTASGRPSEIWVRGGAGVHLPLLLSALSPTHHDEGPRRMNLVAYECSTLLLE